MADQTAAGQIIGGRMSARGRISLLTVYRQVEMSEKFIERYLGVHTADAEQVEFVFAANSLKLRFVDWQDQPRELVLPEALAFRWQEYDGDAAPRDDTTYEVVGSQWLADQQPHNASPLSGQFRHYKLCFNACGTLDVICRVIEVSPG